MEFKHIWTNYANKVKIYVVKSLEIQLEKKFYKKWNWIYSQITIDEGKYNFIYYFVFMVSLFGREREREQKKKQK